MSDWESCGERWDVQIDKLAFIVLHDGRKVGTIIRIMLS